MTISNNTNKLSDQATDQSVDKSVEPSPSSQSTSTSTSTSYYPALSQRTQTTTFYIIHANIILYAFFYWFNQPVLPYLSKELGADPISFGYFQSFNQAVMLLGTIIAGKWIDLKGAKYPLILSHAAGCVSYYMLFNASNVLDLFISQLPTILMSAMHSSQVYITLLSSTAERAKAIGRLSLSYGIGFVLGPIAGGTLSLRIGYANVALISCVGSAIVAAVLTLMLPNIQALEQKDKQKDEDKSKSEASASSSSSSPSNAFSLFLSSTSIRTLVSIKFFLGLSLAMYRSSLAQIAQHQYGLTAQANGFILSFAGSFSILMNTCAVGFLTKRYKTPSIVQWSLCVVTLSFLLSTFAVIAPTPVADSSAATSSLPLSFYLLMAYIIPMTAGGAVCTTLLTAALTQAAALERAGSALALDMGVGTLSRVFGPTVGGWLIAHDNQYVGGASTLIALLAYVIAIASTKHWGDASTKQHGDDVELKEKKKDQ